MKLLLATSLACFVLISEIVCPPVNPNPQPVEGDSPDEDPGFGLEYERYLREVVMALEEDETFRKKLEETNMTDIKSGKIAMHLDLVSHQIRERLDELKRQEIDRLRKLAIDRMKMMNGIQRADEQLPHHIDVKNMHSFQSKDLEKLILKATSDLDELDKKRRGEFKEYEMQKEHEKQEELKRLNEEERKKKEKEYEEMEKKHKQHPKVHHPGSKDQLEGVWEETDKMDPEDFDPKTFFKFHDIDNNGQLDQNEVEALFQKELDQVYDPNMPEDDMRERFEEMARMREHVFGEIDHNKDKLISLEEFLKYTASQEFEKDEGWKTVDEEQPYTDEEFQRYEQMMAEHEQRMRQQGLDPNMVQPGMVPAPHDPNVQQMQMPHGAPIPGHHPDQRQQELHHQQQQFQQFQQQQQMAGMNQGFAGQGGGVPMGQMQGGQIPPHMQGGQMPQGHVPQGQMSQGQMRGEQMPMGQMPQGHIPQGQMPQGGQVPQAGQPITGGQQQQHAQQFQPQQGQPPQGQAQQPIHGQPQQHAQGQPQNIQPVQAQQGQPQGKPQQPIQGQPQQGQPQQPIQGQPQQGQPQQPVQGQPQQGQAQPQAGQEPLKFAPKEDGVKPVV